MFATELSKVIEHAFAVTDPEAKSGEVADPLGVPVECPVVLPAVATPQILDSPAEFF